MLLGPGLVHLQIELSHLHQLERKARWLGLGLGLWLSHDRALFMERMPFWLNKSVYQHCPK